MNHVFCSLLLLLLTPLFGLAQEKNTEHTMKLGAGQKSAPATIADMAWFAGRWTGEGMGGQNEEHWGPPSAGMMLGTFRHSKEGRTVFLEFMSLVEKEGSLVLRIKHFTPDFIGWEEKDKMIEFPFVTKKDGAMYFSGLTFVPKGKDEVTIYLAMKQKEQVKEEVFRLKRAP